VERTDGQRWAGAGTKMNQTAKLAHCRKRLAPEFAPDRIEHQVDTSAPSVSFCTASANGPSDSHEHQKLISELPPQPLRVW